jgi:chromosome partitioning protein
MPVIVFASSKGGSGKSTSAAILATELAERGATVTMIDADPNRPISKWAKHPGKPAKLTVVADVSESTLIGTIEAAARASAFVIVDLEGSASLMISFAMSRADLVVVPTQGTQLDAVEAGKTVQLVKSQEEAFRIRIPAAVLLTRTSAAIRPKGLAAIEAQFRRAGFAVLSTQLHQREAYSAIFSFGCTVAGLAETGQFTTKQIDSASANARAFMTEIVNLLKAAEAPVRAAVVA